MCEHFYLTLVSNSSKGIFPDNKTTHFKTHLSKRVSLTGQWEVGIAEIHYPYSFSTILDREFWIGYEFDVSKFPIAKDGESEEEEEGESAADESGYHTGAVSMSAIRVDNGVGRSVIRFPGGTYSTIDSLILTMTRDLEFQKVAAISTHQARIQIQVKPGVIRLIPSSALRRIFNLTGIEIKDFVEGVNASNIEACIPTQMYVYTDIVEPQHVGDVLAPLLRIVNIDNTQYVFGNQIANIFTHPHYIPLLRKEFQQVEIDIRDDLGYYLPFMQGSLNVKLHFRKIRENK